MFIIFVLQHFRRLNRLTLLGLLCLLSLPVSSMSLVEHEVTMSDGHPLTLYSRIATEPKTSILLIHGRTWSALPDFDLISPKEDLSMMKALAKQGMAVYAIDLRGYGKSARDKSGWNTPNRSSEDIANVLDYINKQHPNLNGPSVFGWSNGSLVAMLTAQLYPEKVKTLTLYGFPLDTEYSINKDNSSKPPARKPTNAKAAAEDFIIPGTISDHAIDAYVKAAVAADPIRMDWHQLSQWNQLDASKVKVPTLLLQAERDPYVNWEADALLFRKLATKDKQWVVLSNADHAALLESARFKLYQSVVSFIEWTEL